MKEKTIKFNPLDLYIDQLEGKDENNDNNKNSNRKNNKKRVTFYIDENILNRLKNAVYWQPGETLTSLVEKSIDNIINKLEKERGEKFKDRKTINLKRGRPIE